MPTIIAEYAEISIENDSWRMYDTTDPTALKTLFQVDRGGGVLNYIGAFAEHRGLPGTRLAANYIQSVVAGFDEKTARWRLGIYVSYSEDEKARWVELVRWPRGNDPMYAQAAQGAGRVLAEYIDAPLKLFGVKKMPNSKQSSITGPLQPHSRKDLSVDEVKVMSENVTMPKEFEGRWLGLVNKKLTIRLPKMIDPNQPGQVAPGFQLIEVDTAKAIIKMLPPTGLLGAFFGTQGRAVRFAEVRNVELRHTSQQLSSTREDEDNDNMLVEVLTKQHSWEVYLTLKNEAVLVARTTHETDGELSQKRSQTLSRASQSGDFRHSMNYYREHETDQKRIEQAESWVRSAAMRLAGELSCRMVVTEVESALI